MTRPQRRIRRPLLVLAPIVAVVALAAAGCGSGGSGAETAAGPGPWPFTASTAAVGGGQIDGGDFEGQDLVLWFWAPW